MQKGFVIRKAADPIITDAIFAVVYGKPGVGKTSLGFTMPGPCLHLDFDEGIHRAVADKPDSVDVSRWEEFADFVNGAEFEELVQANNYRSVLIDTVGTLLDNVIAPALIRRSPKNANGNSLSLAGWGALGTEFGMFINRLRGMGLHIYATAHDKEGGDDATASVLPAVKGGSMDILFRSCDLLGYAYMRGTNRFVDFSPSEIHVGKNVAGLEPLQIPNANNPTSGFASFMADKVVSPTLERMNAKSAAQAELVARIAEFRTRLESCKNPQDFDILSGELKTEPSELFKTQARYFLSGALTKLGIAYDKAQGAFVWSSKPEDEGEPQAGPDHSTAGNSESEEGLQ